MKTIEQLLKLSENPYYKFSPEEEHELNVFLSKKRDEDSMNSVEKIYGKSDFDTRATAGDSTAKSTNMVKVRNVVKKTVPQVEESGL